MLLTFTAFSLRAVEVDFRTSRQYITSSAEEIIESGKIKKGGTIFFRDKKKYIENIENEFPYINVINIETVFPNKFVIHVSERQEVYALKHQSGYYICDEEFRVLRVCDNFESDQQNPILLTLDSEIGVYKAGEFIKEGTNPKLYQAIYENNRSLGVAKELIKSVDVTKKYDRGIQGEIDVLSISLFSGQTLTIANYQYALSYKTYLFFEVYSNMFDMIGKESLQEDGTKVILDENNLKDCEIYIDNFYGEGFDGDHFKENCYFKIFVQTSD